VVLLKYIQPGTGDDMFFSMLVEILLVYNAASGAVIEMAVTSSYLIFKIYKNKRILRCRI
jgi:hypothetical protein